jgi:hypothetical protein
MDQIYVKHALNICLHIQIRLPVAISKDTMTWGKPRLKFEGHSELVGPCLIVWQTYAHVSIKYASLI